MTPVEIVHSAKSDGLFLAMSDKGNIRASGSSVAIMKWSAIIKGSKPEIVAYLMAEEAKVRAWLTQIGEDDPVTINEVIGSIRTTPESRAYFLCRCDQTFQA